MSRRNISALLVAISGLLIGAVAVGAAVVLMSGGSSSSGAQADGGLDGGLDASDTAAATPDPHSGSLPAGSRLVIPSIGVDANVVVVGVDGFGVMGTPDNGLDVGWYDFSTVPGEAGNTVMSGHVDYYDIGPAVFWRLRELRSGDEVQVHPGDGGEAVSYLVTHVESYEAGAAPVDAITGPADDDILTLITCDGWFNPAVREYDHRLVVRAERTS